MQVTKVESYEILTRFNYHFWRLTKVLLSLTVWKIKTNSTV